MFTNALHTTIQRGVAFCFATVLTLAMLGGIDHLATTDAPPALWAAHSTSRA